MSIFGRVRGIISEQTGVDPSDITPESMLVDDFQMDDFDLSEVAVMLSDEFDITISITACLNMRSVQEIVDYIQSKIS